jgi:hypothetical protein
MHTRAWTLVVVLGGVPLMAGAQQHPVSHDPGVATRGPAATTMDVAQNGEAAELLLTLDDGVAPVLTHQRSRDGGATWSAPVPIEPSRGGLSGASRGVDPQIAASGQTLVVLWMGKGQSSRGNGLMDGARSRDGGLTWVALGRIDDTPRAVSQAFIDVVADRQGRFHAVWLDSRDGGQGLRVSSSTDEGQTWSAATTIDARTCECCWNTVAESGDSGLVVLYRDKDPRDMALTRSTDGGRTWTRTGAVGAFGWAFDGCPHVGGALAPGRLPGGLHALVWTGHDERRGAHAVHSADGGVSWGEPVRVGPPDAWHVDLMRAADRLVAAYDVNRSGDPHVAWAESRDDGRTWTDRGRLSAPGARASHPKIVAGARRVTVMWTERHDGQPLQWQRSVVIGSGGSTDRRR